MPIISGNRFQKKEKSRLKSAVKLSRKSMLIVLGQILMTSVFSLKRQPVSFLIKTASGKN